MKAILPLLLAAALLHAEAPSPAAATPATSPAVAETKPHAESAESGSPVGGAGERSEPEGVTHAEPAGNAETKPHAEPAESGSPAGGAGERSETEGVPHAEPAERAEPAITGGASSPSEPTPARRGRRAQRPPLRAEVSLIDGSILQGALRPRFLPARSPSLGEFRIDLAKVERIDFIPSDSPAGPSAGGARSGRREGARGAAEPGRGATSQSRVAFRNGDRLTVRFPDDLRFLPFDTLLGRVRLPLRAVSSISFNPSTPSTSSTLIYHCTFDSASSIARPAAGPTGRLLGGSFVAGRKGNALRVEKDAAAFEAALPKGFLGREGCIEFWAKIEGDDPRYVDGGDPLFFSLFDERGAVTLLQFAANNGFARGGLGGAIVSWPFGTVAHWSGSMPYEGVLGPDWAGWHHYAMSWKAAGFGDGSFVKVFVDGKPQPVLGGVDDDKVPARLADLPNHDFLLGFPWARSRGDNRRSKKPFLIDEFKIWKTARTEFDR